MTVRTFTTSDAPQAINLVDATIDNEIVVIERAATIGPNVGVTTTKVDATVHTVTVKDPDGVTLGSPLLAQWDSLYLLSDGTTWNVVQTPDSAVVADAVAEGGGAPLAIAPPDPTAVIDATAKTCLQSIIGVLQTAGYYS